MQFNSYYFILFFLPITLVLYYLTNKITPQTGKIIVIISSLLFYSLGRTGMLIYLGISIFINYFSALSFRKYKIKKKVILAIPIIVNVGLLIYFKYLNFAINNINFVFGKNIHLQNIILPLGISFYTFQQIAYIVASERGELTDNNLIDYLTYILYFPKIIMGPIVDPVDFINQINDNSRKKVNATNIAIGLKLFSYGLIKKVLLADTFSKAVAWGYSELDAITSMDALLLVLFYAFEIYFDFSGYSDMAIGVSYMFNIELPINFDSPYKALSIRDFWKKWHISLTQFFTKYIYIPLGGSKKGQTFTYINILIVFFVSGLWHGVGWKFIIWGLLHGILCCLDRIFKKYEDKIFAPIRWLCTFSLVSFLWLSFSVQSNYQIKTIIQKIFHMKDSSISTDLYNSFNLQESQFIYNIFHINNLVSKIRGFNMYIFIVVGLFICLIPKNNYRNKDKFNIVSLILASIAFVWGVLCLGTESIFIYNGF